ncbi:MAG TPA: SAM-dependent chlorinase/fluorinase [Candidatus Polarisedimenticolia bacterium]|nr:SAM-dependent chlorinase/fluorinase [Candidatus Polarisedimenticolia bacterium]
MTTERGPIVTLTTDFGGSDHYVAAVKAAILAVAPEATLVDVSHEIPAHDVRAGAWVLRNAAPSFPRRTIHLAVVDPGVGTPRRPIAAVTQNHIVVGPDNGLFSYLFDLEPPLLIAHIAAAHYTRPDPSPVFHARDIFGPAAGHLARGADPANMGPPVDKPVTLELPRARVGQDGTVKAGVAHVDRFGNVVLYVTRAAVVGLLERLRATHLEASTGGVRVTGWVKAYGEAPQGRPVLLLNSSGFVEIGMNQGRASDLLKLKPGDYVDLLPAAS